MKPLALLVGLAALFLSSTCNAALTTVSNFGNNPTNLEMQIYLPAKLATKPAVVVAVSYQAWSLSQ